MEPSVFSKPSADGFHLKNIDFPKKWQKETSFEKIFEKVKTVTEKLCSIINHLIGFAFFLKRINMIFRESCNKLEIKIEVYY